MGRQGVFKDSSGNAWTCMNHAPTIACERNTWRSGCRDLIAAFRYCFVARDGKVGLWRAWATRPQRCICRTSARCTGQGMSIGKMFLEEQWVRFFFGGGNVFFLIRGEGGEGFLFWEVGQLINMASMEARDPDLASHLLLQAKLHLVLLVEIQPPKKVNSQMPKSKCEETKMPTGNLLFLMPFWVFITFIASGYTGYIGYIFGSCHESSLPLDFSNFIHFSILIDWLRAALSQVEISTTLGWSMPLHVLPIWEGNEMVHSAARY